MNMNRDIRVMWFLLLFPTVALLFVRIAVWFFYGR
jgi:hypothetical protein